MIASLIVDHQLEQIIILMSVIYSSSSLAIALASRIDWFS